jgi:glutathione S-transferase
MRLFTYSGSANGYKIELALALLGRSCERIEVPIFAGASHTPDFLARSPSGRVPVLELDDGTALPESNAILWYLAQDTPLLPAGPALQARALAWMFFEQNEIEPVLGSARFWRLTGRDRDRGDELGRRIAQGRGSLAALDRHLTGKDALVGPAIGVADLAVYAYTHLAPDVGIDLAAYPAVARWCSLIEALPRYVAGPAPYSSDAIVR